MSRLCKILIALAVGFLLAPALVSAQTVLTVNSVEFVPSPDHNVLSGTTPILTSYELSWATQAAPSVVVGTKNLGKPAPQVDNGKIFLIVPEIGAVTPGVVYVPSLVAVGPAGRSAPVVGNPFVVALPPLRMPAAPGSLAVK